MATKFEIARRRANPKARYRKRDGQGRWSLTDAKPAPKILYPTMAIHDPTPHAVRLREILARSLP